MACPCRALRGLTLARAPFPRPALPAPSYRAYSTGAPDPPPGKGPESALHQGSQPNEKPATSDMPPKAHSEPAEKPRTFDLPRSYNKPGSDRPGSYNRSGHDRPRSRPMQSFDSYASQKPPNERGRRTTGPHDPEPEKPQRREKLPWQAQKDALREKFPMGWAPAKKLSPDTISGMRALNAQFPKSYTTPVLSNLFGVSAEAVRRILKGNWAPSTAEKEEERRARWTRRGERVWGRWAGMGIKVPTKWRPEGVSKWGGRVQGTRGEEGHEEERAVEGYEEELHEEEVQEEEVWKTEKKKGAGRNVKARRRVTERLM